MKRTVSRILLLVMLLSLCLPIANYVYAKENIKVIINGICVDDDAYVETLGDRLYVSARSIANPMGLNLEWNDVKKTLRIFHRDITISLIVANDIVVVNNSALEAQEPLKIVSDRAIVDLGFLCQLLDVPMTFNENDNSYNITINVPESFQPDVISPKKIHNNITLFGDDSVEKVRVKDLTLDLGLEAFWDDSTKTLILTNGLGDELTLTIGSSYAQFNGEQIPCPAPLEITNDESYIAREFVEKLFAIQPPQSYIPVRQIAEEQGIDIEWCDDTKTVKFIAENGDVLSMSVGSSYYTFNDKFYDNSAPMIIKDDIASTDPSVVADAFSKIVLSADDTIELTSADKTFSGQLIFEKSLETSTYIDVIAINVRSIVYSNYYGPTYTDYDVQSVYVPASTRTVDYSVTKTNCSSNDSYIIGYYFPEENDYYYRRGFLGYNGDSVTNLSTYIYDYSVFYYYDTSSNITIKPKCYYDVAYDDVIFSGTIRTTNGVGFDFGRVNVSVRSATYYGETVLNSVNLYPEDNSFASFSIPVDNTTSTRYTSLYLRYDLYDGHTSLQKYGYYHSDGVTVKSRSDAKKWNITSDDLSYIDFVVLAKGSRTVSGTFYLPDTVELQRDESIIFDIDVLTVQNTVYGQTTYYPYTTYSNVAEISAGDRYTNYSLPLIMDDGDTYIFRYRNSGTMHKVLPYGYATNYYTTMKPAYAKKYTTASDLSQIDFYIQNTSEQYTYINNLPYKSTGRISSTENTTDRGSYYQGYYIYLTEGETVTIDLKSIDFDAFLYLLDENMNIISYNDDSLGNDNARITRYIYDSGYYYIQAASYSTYETGKFSISIATDKELGGSAVFSDTDYGKLTSIGSNEIIQANYKLQNNGYDYRGVKLMLAAYDKYNNLLKAEFKDTSILGFSDNEFLTIDIKGLKDVAKVKSFIWTDALTPIANVDCLYK